MPGDRGSIPRPGIRKGCLFSFYLYANITPFTLFVRTNIFHYLNIFFSNSFIPLINKPTRISKYNATIIDHLLTNTFINKNYITGILKTDISDHFPVFFISETELSKTNQSNFVYKRKITNIKLTNFKETLLRIHTGKNP